MRYKYGLKNISLITSVIRLFFYLGIISQKGIFKLKRFMETIWQYFKKSLL
jgi:hypothetical protein